jgi:transcriptional regulator with XRE-family HTH domain
MSTGNAGSLPPYLSVPLGDVVRAWRLIRQLTLDELAARAGSRFTRGYLSQVENGRIRNPANQKILLLARALDVDPLVLVERRFPAQAGGEDFSAVAPAVEGQGDPTSVGELSLAADVSRLLAVLKAVPTARQQLYVDALTALVERFAMGEGA